VELPQPQAFEYTLAVPKPEPAFLLPTPEPQFEPDWNLDAFDWSCTDANGIEIPGSAFSSLDGLTDLLGSEDVPVACTAPWERYAELLASVPAEDWSPALLDNFCAEELRQMLSQASALAPGHDTPVRERPDLDQRFGGLGIALDEELEVSKKLHSTSPVKARLLPITPPTRSTSCSSNGSTPRESSEELGLTPMAPFALPCLLPSPSSCRVIAQGA
jgi:hypothetical protein